MGDAAEEMMMMVMVVMKENEDGKEKGQTNKTYEMVQQQKTSREVEGWMGIHHSAAFVSTRPHSSIHQHLASPSTSQSQEVSTQEACLPLHHHLHNYSPSAEHTPPSHHSSWDKGQDFHHYLLAYFDRTYPGLSPTPLQHTHTHTHTGHFFYRYSIMDNQGTSQSNSDLSDSDNGSSVGTSVGIGVGVGLLLLLLLASVFYNLYLRLRLKCPAQQPGEGGGAEGNGVFTSESGHYRGNITETTQIVSRSRSPGPYVADNQAIRVTPSRVLEKKKSNTSTVSQISSITPSNPNGRKVSNVSTRPMTPSQLPGKDQNLSPSASTLNTENIYVNVAQESTHYVNITGAQALPQDYEDDQNIYEDIS
ncbi:hypothetical protein Pcinc_044035 [Petrolisthes cinctipes]|uniref:Uncharacterized protein n=1 Tax=Petrolisthes cinctipes TaxID=88211 RepID=A0AAE1BFF4_PETCI|nr:hypothetical protein Pcinc_044035 [Petrolisthes cinctipes]